MERERTVASFISGVLHNYVRLVVLEISEREKDDISLIDPDLIGGVLW